MVHPYLRHPDLEPTWPVAFAHRGGHDVAPENTMTSFENAVGLGYRYLETDAHLTADGVLVSFHDPDLRRTCGIDAHIAEMTAAEVADARVAGQHPIPTLEEVFDTFPGVRFNIDAKSDAAVEPLCEMIQQRSMVDRVCLASFSLRRIRRMRAIVGSELMTNMAPVEIASLRLTGRVPGGSHRSAQVPTAAGRIEVVTGRFVENARRANIAVHVWTINERAEMDRLLDLGVGGIMTDETAELRDALQANGRWPV